MYVFLQWKFRNNNTEQRAKKVVSDSAGLVDFGTGLVILVLNLPGGQVLFFFLGNSNTEDLLINKGFRAS